MSEKRTILSCIQPTGEMHLGNYFGAVQNWVALQENYKCYYGIVDYHAMTMPYDTKKLRTFTWDLVIDLLAVGIQPENLFIQSLVPEHVELAWIFNCFCSYGQLTRMTQFKDKSSQVQEKSKDEFISAGLLNYPVLQAADILIYKAHYVPVGKDQEQHLELTRDIAMRFNYQVGKDYFVLPESLYTDTPKIRSTADPSKKMSKSAGEKHYISVFGEENRIRKQIKSAVTDTGLTESGKMSEGVENLFLLLKASGNMEAYRYFSETFEKGALQYSGLKEEVANSLVKMTSAFIEKREEIRSNKKQIKDQIKSSSAKIRQIAKQTVRETKELAGLLNID
ncbi:MAG TPA: tryptophan--tRNA ligase [Saprospiraceae bacterium]|nr:tryptophan--tRNA ligase [Saprospiraceae bacterium]